MYKYHFGDKFLCCVVDLHPGPHPYIEGRVVLLYTDEPILSNPLCAYEYVLGKHVEYILLDNISWEQGVREINSAPAPLPLYFVSGNFIHFVRRSDVTWQMYNSSILVPA